MDSALWIFFENGGIPRFFSRALEKRARPFLRSIEDGRGAHAPCRSAGGVSAPYALRMLESSQVCSPPHLASVSHSCRALVNIYHDDANDANPTFLAHPFARFFTDFLSFYLPPSLLPSFALCRSLSFSRARRNCVQVLSLALFSFSLMPSFARSHSRAVSFVLARCLSLFLSLSLARSLASVNPPPPPLLPSCLPPSFSSYLTSG